MGRLKHIASSEAKNDFEKYVYRLIEDGVSFSVVRVNDEGEHVLQPHNKDKEYKFDGHGRLMNGGLRE